MKKNERTKFLLTLGCILVSIAMMTALIGCPEQDPPGPKPPPKGAYTITKENTTNGSFTVSATNGFPGDEIILVPTPADGNSRFTSWTISPDYVQISGPNADGEYMFEMPDEAVTVGAIFTRLYTITAAEGITGGTIAINPVEAATGATFQVTVTPDPGMELDEISSTPFLAFEQQGTTNRYNFTMGTANVVINATFNARVYQVRKGTVTGGDLAFSAETAVAGTEITITVTTNANFDFNNFITTPATLVITDDKFIMPASDVTIGAKFNPIPTTKLPTPVGAFFTVVSGTGALEFDRGRNLTTALILGYNSGEPGNGDVDKSEYDGLDGRGAEVAEARFYCFPNATAAGSGDPAQALGYFIFRGKILYSADYSVAYDIIANGGGGAGYNAPGNWYLQENMGAMLNQMLGTNYASGIVIRPRFIAAGSDRAFDSDFGTARGPHTAW